jgi:hypothetical protein
MKTKEALKYDYNEEVIELLSHDMFIVQIKQLKKLSKKQN